jgi:NAD(P)H dehydrogenase (quinone)
MSHPTLLVTGAAGHLGRAVVELLLGAGQRVIAGTRDPSRVADLASKGAVVRKLDLDDPDTLPDAFLGVDRVLLVSTDRVGSRVQQHKNGITAAARAGVRHIAYTSLLGAPRSSVGLAPEHVATERALAESGVGYTALRNSVYADLLIQSLQGAVASGQLVTARGQGGVSYITREDCARAAAAALSSTFEGTRELELTGPEALTGDDLAQIASALTGRPVRHVSVPVSALVEGMVAHGLPEPVAEIYASFDTAAADGELAVVTPTFRELVGRPPQSVRDFLRSRLS